MVVSLMATMSFAAKEEEKATAAVPSEKSDAQKTATTVVTYPVNVAREAGEVAVNVVKKVVSTSADTAQAVGQTVTGDVKKAPEIVITPIKGTAEGLVETTTGTVSIPAEALKDSKAAAEGKSAEATEAPKAEEKAAK